MDPAPRPSPVDPATVTGTDAGSPPAPGSVAPPTVASTSGPTPLQPVRPELTPAAPKRRSRKFILSSAALSLGGIVLAFLTAKPTGSNVTPFLVVAFSMVLFMLAIGREIIGLWLGTLIDERNVMSLPRLQAALWTVVILSGFLTAALVRTRAGVPDALVINVDWHLWALLGISVTSLTGSALIFDAKRSKEPKDSNTIQTSAENLDVHPTVLDQTRQGTLFTNPSPHDARFSDLFEGDEVGNGAQIDLGKVQLFYFTVVAALAYSVLMARMFQTLTPDQLGSLPALPDGLVALLGISHAGYLGHSAVDHTDTK